MLLNTVNKMDIVLNAIKLSLSIQICIWTALEAEDGNFKQTPAATYPLLITI